jgi:hypothetical protein
MRLTVKSKSSQPTPPIPPTRSNPASKPKSCNRNTHTKTQRQRSDLQSSLQSLFNTSRLNLVQPLIQFFPDLLPNDFTVILREHPWRKLVSVYPLASQSLRMSIAIEELTRTLCIPKGICHDSPAPQPYYGTAYGCLLPEFVPFDHAIHGLFPWFEDQRFGSNP